MSKRIVLTAIAFALLTAIVYAQSGFSHEIGGTIGSAGAAAEGKALLFQPFGGLSLIETYSVSASVDLRFGLSLVFVDNSKIESLLYFYRGFTSIECVCGIDIAIGDVSALWKKADSARLAVGISGGFAMSRYNFTELVFGHFFAELILKLVFVNGSGQSISFSTPIRYDFRADVFYLSLGFTTAVSWDPFGAPPQDDSEVSA